MRMRLDARTLLRNACGNSVAFAAQAAAAFVLTPYVLRALGDARFGAWSFVESFIAYLTLFDLGLAAALVRFVPRRLTVGDRAGLDRLYSASLLFFAAGAAVALSIGAVFDACLLERFLAVPGQRGEFRWLFRILVLNFAATLPLSVYPAMLDGLGRFEFKGAVRIGVLALRVPLTLAVLRSANPLLALAGVVTACNLLEHALLAVGVRRTLPDLRFRPSDVDRTTVCEVAGYSVHAFAAMIAGRLAFHTDAFVIGPILGPASITIFSIPSGLVERCKAALRSATMTLTSAFSAFESTGDTGGLRATFLSATRWAWYAALPTQAGLLLLGHAFLSLWVGRDHADVCAPVLYPLASVVALSAAQSVASRVLYGTGHLRGFVWAAALEGVANLLLSLALIQPLGVIGVAWGTAIPHALFCLAVIAMVGQLYHVRIVDYLRQVCRPIMLVTPVAIAWAWVASAGVTRWTQLIAVGLGGMALYVVLVLVAERSSRVTRPSGRLRANLFRWPVAG